MYLRTTHRTIYHYATPPVESHNEVRLEPTTEPCQTCLDFDISCAPSVGIHSFEEVGGKVHFFTLRKPHRSLEILATSEVETRCNNPFDGLNLLGPDLDFYDSDWAKQQFAEFLVPSRFVSESREAFEVASKIKAEAGGIFSKFLLNLNRFLFDHLVYDPDVTHVHSTVDEVLALKAGVCQDFAHVMIACCRSVGIPARYVSGYLYSSRGSGIRGSTGMHAWLECPLPEGGWLSIDPTNNLLANDHYIRVHTGRDYADITPLRGLYIGTRSQKMDVEISVEEFKGGGLARQDIA